MKPTIVDVIGDGQFGNDIEKIIIKDDKFPECLESRAVTNVS